MCLRLGHVAEDAHEVRELAAGVEQRRHRQRGVDQRAVLTLVDHLALPAHAPRIVFQKS